MRDFNLGFIRDNLVCGVSFLRSTCILSEPPPPHISERLEYFAASYIREDEAPANLAKILECEWKLVYCKWTFCNICILHVIVETVIKFRETMYLQYRQVKMKNRRVEIWNMHVDTLSFFFVINSRLYFKMKEQIIYIFLI